MKYAIIAGVLALIVLLGSCSGITQVDTGHRGVKTSFGKVVDGPLTEGIYFYNPFIYDIVQLDTRVQIMEGQSMAYTKDVQQTTLTYILNYSLKPEFVVPVFQGIGHDWAVKIVTPVVQANIKEVLGQFEAVDLISNREKAKQAVVAQIKDELESRGVDTINFEFANLDFSDEFEQAVEAKVTAIQRAAEAKNKTVQVREEADQKVIAAKAEAESMQIRSQALSQNKGLVEYEAVQKWNGILPVYMMGGAIPFMSLSLDNKRGAQ
jgi:regulator of protease activity HflC (stomatin/prohibitin superfamily)